LLNASRYACEQFESRILFATTYTLTNLGSLGGAVVQAFDVNGSNQVAGSSTTATNIEHAFRYSGGVMTDIGTFGGSTSSAHSINPTGLMTGVAKDATETDRAFLYNGTTMVDIGTLGGLDAHGAGINASGTIVGGSSTAGGSYHAFRYTTAGGMVDLGTTGGFPYSDAYGVNATGQVVGVAFNDVGAATAWVNTAGVFTPISLGGSYAFGWDINDSGAAVGEGFLTGDSSYRAFLYADGRTISLGTLAGYGASEAYGINNNGQIVGRAESTTPGGLSHGFLYTGGRMLDLNTLVTVPGGGVITEARSISNTGRIVGFGVIAGATRAFLLTPVTTDTTAPTATGSAAGVTVAGATSHNISVTYNDNVALEVASIGTGDVRVTGPNGFSQIASFVSIDNPTDGTPRNVTYSITPPGGSWDFADNGTYVVRTLTSQVADTGSLNLLPSQLATFLVNVPDTTPPNASLNANDLTTGGGTTYNFTVTFTDNNKLSVATLDSSDVTVTNTLGFSQTATFVSVNNATDGTPRTATYQITAPGGSWDTADNDTYTVSMNASQVSDPAGNFVVAGSLGTFAVNVDTTKPTVSTFSAANLTVGFGTTYQFTVTYADNVAIKRSTLDGSDVRVTGPNAFNQLASLVSINAAGDGTPRTATYRINAPGGTWDTGDNGTYTLALEAGQVTDPSNNAADAGTIGTFDVSVDTIKPTVSTFSASNVSTAGGTTYQFTVTYADNVALAAASFDGSDVRVTGPNSFNQLASLVSVDTAGDGTPRTATYQINAPGGSWDSGDDDTYTLSVESAQVADTSGNTVNTGTIGTFLVDIPDVTAPTFSSLSAGNVTSGGGTTYQFTVTYADNYKVKVSTLDSSDVTVTNTLGFTQTATFVSVNTATDGTPRTATYSITPPGGSWDTADNDTYTVALNDSQVSDPAGNFVASGTLGTFTVNVDTVKPTVSTYSASNVTVGGGTTYQFSVTYADNVAVKGSSLGNNDVRVTGPSAFNQLATFVSVNTPGDGTPRTVTYQITTPGGSWDTADNGTYTLALEASQVTDTSNNAADAVASIGTFSVNVDTIKPTVSTFSAATVTTAGGTSYQFTVTYADNAALSAASFDGSDVRVTGPGAFDQLASFVSVDTAGDGTPRTVTYQITPPGGTWDGADVGTYTLALQTSQIADTSANTANAVTIGTFTVDLPETVAPTASLTAGNVTSGGGTSYQFTVTYSDNNKVKVSTIDSSDVTVTNTLGFSQTATLVSVDVATDGTPRTATYSITPPGGSWDSADTDTYTVSMNTSQVSDLANNFVAAGSLGTFSVSVDSTKPTVSAFSASNVTTSGATTYQFTVTYADNVAIQASTLGNNDIRVTGPNAFNQLATFVSVDTAGDGTPRTVTYQITPPGGSWDLADNGTYTLALEASQVTDTSGNAADAVASIGTFSVAVPPVVLSAGVLTVTGGSANDVISLALNGAGDTLTVTVNGTPYPFAYPGTITKITVNANGGNDTVTVGAGIIGTSLNGSSGADTLTGGTGNDSLNGGDGNDRLVGGLGNDSYLFANAGSVQTDTVVENAGEGTDTLDFSSVTNAVTVNLTSDIATATHTSRTVVTGAAGQAANFENVNGGSAADNITGNAAANSLAGMGGNDTLTGSAGNDSLTGGGGSDSLVGGTNDDLYTFAAASSAETDTIVELAGEGTDTLTFSALTTAVTINFTSDTTTATHTNRTVKTGAAGQVANLENATGGTAGDVMTGNNAANKFLGGAGSDNLSGGAGNDTLSGDEGNDTMAGGTNDDTYLFATAAAAQTDVINEAAASGTDTLDFSALTTAVTANLTLDTNTVTHTNRTINTSAAGQAANFENLVGGSGNDVLTGNNAANTITGNNGADTITGGEGSDSLVGGAGNDVYSFAAASSVQTDTVVELAGGGTDTLNFSALTSGVAVTVNLNSDATTATHTNRTVKTGAAGQAANIDNVTGGAGNDIITGNNLNNTLSGGGGNDSISGGAGNDQLLDGEGSDTLVGGTGNDVYKFSNAGAAQTDRVSENSGEGTDTLDFSAVTNNVTINLSSNTLATHTNRTVSTFTAGQFAFIDNATGGTANDTITGNTLANQLLGMGGNDTFFAQDGTALVDTVDGGLGTDTVSSSDASDSLLNFP
jgi:probable HAF family extracellular repeat protein